MPTGSEQAAKLFPNCDTRAQIFGARNRSKPAAAALAGCIGSAEARIPESTMEFQILESIASRVSGQEIKKLEARFESRVRKLQLRG
jgi:hypothetical protein